MFMYGIEKAWSSKNIVFKGDPAGVVGLIARATPLGPLDGMSTQL